MLTHTDSSVAAIAGATVEVKNTTTQIAIIFSLLLALLALPEPGIWTGSKRDAVRHRDRCIRGGMPNASVQVTNVATGVRPTMKTDSQGLYTVVDLIVGTYEVQASAPGFQTVVRTGITPTVGSQMVVDVVLSPGQQQQTVTVQARPPRWTSFRRLFPR